MPIVILDFDGLEVVTVEHQRLPAFSAQDQHLLLPFESVSLDHKAGHVELNQMEYEDVAEVLGKEHVDDSEESSTGVYNRPDEIVIEVRDENDNLIFDSTTQDEWFLIRMLWMNILNTNQFTKEKINSLLKVIAKGNFFQFKLECDEFDPNKLSPQLTEIGERFELITGLRYEGEILESEFDDYWGKGYYYHLSDEE